jgi:chromosome segregation ATPase
MNENTSPEGQPETPAPEAAPAPLPAPQEFLKKHVRGIPKEQLAEKRVYYGFKYKDLKAFIEQIVGQYKGIENPQLIARISELEMALQSLRGQKEAAEAKAQETAAGVEKARAEGETAQSLAASAQAERETASAASNQAGADAAKELEARLQALAGEKAALEARVAELEKGLSGAGETDKRAADLSAELAALRENFTKLEGENEFIDGEMTKLDESAKALAERLAKAEAEEQALREEKEKAASAFDGERKTLAEKAARLEGIVNSSGDAKKLAEMQKRFETYEKVFQAYENAAEEMVDLERRPDEKSVDARIGALRGTLPAGAPSGDLLILLENRLAAVRKEIGEHVQAMYGWRGSFRLVVDLEKAVVREQELAGALDLLERSAK